MRLTSEIRKRIMANVADRWDRKNPADTEAAAKVLKAKTNKGYIDQWSVQKRADADRNAKRSEYLSNVRIVLDTFSTIEALEDGWPEIMKFTSGIVRKPTQIKLVY